VGMISNPNRIRAIPCWNRLRIYCSTTGVARTGALTFFTAWEVADAKIPIIVIGGRSRCCLFWG
jgi:hypothetical protein